MNPTWGIVVPQGEWVDTYPTTNGRIIQGIRLAALYVGFILGLIVVILIIAVIGPADKLKVIPWDVIDGFLQLLAWFIGAMMAVAAAQYVGKRATTDPVTVKAVSDAKIAEAATGTFPVATLVPAKTGLPVPPIAAAHSFDPGA